MNLVAADRRPRFVKNPPPPVTDPEVLSRHLRKLLVTPGMRFTDEERREARGLLGDLAKHPAGKPVDRKTQDRIQKAVEVIFLVIRRSRP
jgi:hypothetical protein